MASEACSSGSASTWRAPFDEYESHWVDGVWDKDAEGKTYVVILDISCFCREKEEFDKLIIPVARLPRKGADVQRLAKIYGRKNPPYMTGPEYAFLLGLALPRKKRKVGDLPRVKQEDDANIMYADDEDLSQRCCVNLCAIIHRCACSHTVAHCRRTIIEVE